MSVQTEEKKRPEISVIVPVYNVAPYLSACLDSVLAQTFRDFELILVEDGSTDGSREIAEAYAAKDVRVRIIEHRWNRGAATSYAHGLELSRGEYIAFVDCDDMIVPTNLEVLQRAAEASNADVVQAGFRTFSEKMEDGKVFAWTRRPGFLPGTLTGRMQHFLPVRIHIAPWSKLFRRDFLNMHHIDFFDVPVAPDVCFHYQCVLTAWRYLVIPDILYYYRQRQDSVESVQGLQRAERYAVAMARILDAFTEWLRQEKMFQDPQVKHQVRQPLYVFLLHQLRELAKTDNAEEVYAHARRAWEHEATEALRDAAMYDAIMRK